MPDIWTKMLSRYLYPVRLSCFEYSNRFPQHFNKNIIGDRKSTIAFENYFRENAKNTIEVYFEVVFWKLYSQANNRQRGTIRIMNYITSNKIAPKVLFEAMTNFVDMPSRRNLQNFHSLLGIKTNVLAVPLTFISFFNPKKFPMVDNVVARWVNQNFAKHNNNRQNKLTPFIRGYTSLRDNDFENYLNWVGWCNEVAKLLTKRTCNEWRARDVEMAVFTAERKSLQLNAVSIHPS